MKCFFGNMMAEFNIFHVAKQPGCEGEFCEIDLVDDCVEEKFETSMYSDPLQLCLINSEYEEDNSETVDEYIILHDFISQIIQLSFVY